MKCSSSKGWKCPCSQEAEGWYSGEVSSALRTSALFGQSAWRSFTFRAKSVTLLDVELTPGRSVSSEIRGTRAPELSRVKPPVGISAPHFGNCLCVKERFMRIWFSISPQSGTTAIAIHFSQRMMNNLWQPGLWIFFLHWVTTNYPLLML